MAKLYNLARMTVSGTPGTGTITLAAAVSGFLTFALAGVANGDVVAYGIRDGANSEVGTGTYTTAGTTLTRTPISSTNGNAAISATSAAEVFITPVKEDIANLRETNTFTGANIFGLGIIIPDNSGVYDGNVNEYLLFQSVASAANYVEIENNVAGGGPIIRATGSDTNVTMNYQTKGTGIHDFNAKKIQNGFNVAGEVVAFVLNNTFTASSAQVDFQMAAGTRSAFQLSCADSTSVGSADFYTNLGRLRFITAQAGQYMVFDAGDHGNAQVILEDGGDVGIGLNGITVARRLVVREENASTNVVTYAARLQIESSGTPAIGIGTGLEFSTETSGGVKQGATIEARATNISGSTDSFVLDAKQMATNALGELLGLSFLHRSYTADTAYTNNNTVQQWFLSSGAVDVEASTTYEFEGLLLQTPGTTSHTVGLSFAGTATLTSISYLAEESPTLVNATLANTSNVTQVNVATNTVVTPAITTAGTAIWVRGIVRINAVGTFIPQFTFSAAPGAGNNLKGTFFKMRKVGTNTNTAQGRWT